MLVISIIDTTLNKRKHGRLVSIRSYHESKKKKSTNKKKKESRKVRPKPTGTHEGEKKDSLDEPVSNSKENSYGIKRLEEERATLLLSTRVSARR